MFLKSVLFVLTVALFLPANRLFSQNITSSFSLEWEDIGIRKPYTRQCVYDDSVQFIPVVIKKIEIPANSTVSEVLLANVQTAACSAVFEDVKRDELSEQFEITYDIGTIKKKQILIVKIKALALITGQPALIKNADIVITAAQKVSQQNTIKVPILESVLKTGYWRRVKITESGVYKITYEQLVSWGFSNPENIRVYGQGGYLLSTRNSANDPEDLVENPVYMTTNNEGSFSSGNYILFYGQGVTRWQYDTINKSYRHETHTYFDHGYYYLTTSFGNGKRIETSNINATADYTTSEVDYNLFREFRNNNYINSGRKLYGEQILPDNSQNFTFDFPMGRIITENVTVQTSVIGLQQSQSSTNPCYFLFKAGNTDIHASFMNGSTNEDNWATAVNKTPLIISETSPVISTEFKSNSISSRGALDYIRVTGRIPLSLTQTNRIVFSDFRNIKQGTFKQYLINGENIQVFNVTDPFNPKIMELHGNGLQKSWIYSNNEIEYYVAFNDAGTLSVEDAGTIANQNLHGQPTPDMVILTAPAFRSEAERLAKFRRDGGLRVLVVEPQEVYNEFSNGLPDISAVRNFMRMFYRRTEGNELKFLLLIGDGSYNNKWGAQQSNYLLTYQSKESTKGGNSYVSDDFFGLLDTEEGGDNFYKDDKLEGYLDIAIGRLPVETFAEASAVISKIISYSQNPKLDSWKNELVFLSDDANGNSDGSLQRDTYEISQIITNKYPWFNPNLILMDAYQQISTPSGHRYPAVNDAINGAIHKGTLLFNYYGHGSPNRLAHEEVVNKVMVNSWKNKDYLTFFVTTSCEVSRYDNIANKSLGELMLLNPDGGAIALFTTTRSVYADITLNRHFYNRIFERKSDGDYSSIGEIMADAKNQMGYTDTNYRSFTLLGDPSLKLILPPYVVATDSMNGLETKVYTDTIVYADTIKALQKVSIAASIIDSLGNFMQDFNGIAYTTIYDKPKTRQTLNNDGNGVFEYKTQSNIIYKGKSTVNNGRFSFEFIVPYDIDYDMGVGKISYYAQNNRIDAHGAFRNFKIGGSSNYEILDYTGPEIKVYLNDSSFVAGGTVNESPLLLSYLFDSIGINTTGIGLGHEIVLKLKHGSDSTITVLNNYYENDQDSYQSGVVKYQLMNLPDGESQITLCAWDIVNNYTEESVDFVVANTETAALSHVLNYPNPFTTNTKFLFEHNQSNVVLDVTIQIFTVSGRLIKTLHNFVSGNNTTVNSPLTWDGRDDFGDRIGRGVYIYLIKIKTPDGKTASKYEKLVLLK